MLKVRIWAPEAGLVATLGTVTLTEALQARLSMPGTEWTIPGTGTSHGHVTVVRAELHVNRPHNEWELVLIARPTEEALRISHGDNAPFRDDYRPYHYPWLNHKTRNTQN